MRYPGSLHGHTEYSNARLRDSTNRTSELINYAIELGHNVIAFTEHDCVSNAVKIEKIYKKIKEQHPNFKVIRGNEIYLCRNGLDNKNFVRGEDKYFHFILLAKDAIGHEQIRELSTRAWSRSYVAGKMRRVPTYYDDIVDVIGSNPGHVIGSTACLGGFLPTKLLQYREMTTDEMMSEVKELFYEKIISWINSMVDIFGKQNFYLEMQPSNNEEQIYVNKELVKLANITGVSYIITCDEHYLKKEDAPIHKAFLNSQDGDREVDSFYETTYLMSDEEIKSFFSYFTETEFEIAYNNIQKIADMCEDYTLLRPLKIPNLKWRNVKGPIYLEKYYDVIPWMRTFAESEYASDVRLAELVAHKLDTDSRAREEKIYKELNNNFKSTWESSEVNKARWSAYFLNLQYILDICWKAGTLVGPGRGSGVGFLLLWALDIIQINKCWESTETFAWRFLNPARVSVLDIDSDIEGSKRAQVLQALRQEYGEDRVANVVTFGTESSKSAIQTAARGLGIDNDVSMYISSLVPSDRGKIRTLKQCYYGDDSEGFDPIPLFVQQMNEYPDLWKVAQRIEGLVSRIGEHAGGVIFVDEPFTKSTALMKVPNGDTVTQYDLHDAEECSLIKIDLLSVECLDKIHSCLDLLCDAGYIEKQETLKETYDKYLDIYDIERKDKNMWQMVWNHEIQSLFQMEKQSGVQGIALTKPESVDDLAVLNSVNIIAA